MYLNVMSLDAPLLALLWLYVFADYWDVSYVDPLLAVVLPLVVWLIYSIDRLADCSLHKDCEFPIRHRFHQRHKKVFIGVIAVVSLLVAVLSLNFLQWSVVQSAMAPVAATVGFFLLSFFSEPGKRVSYAKNLLAGFAFAWGVGSGLVGLDLSMNIFAKLLSREMLCFGLLCVINITAVDLWVKGSSELDADLDEWALTLALVVLGLFCMLFMGLKVRRMDDPFYVAILIATALMYMLNRSRGRMTADFLRIAADLVLLVSAASYWLLRDLNPPAKF